MKGENALLWIVLFLTMLSHLMCSQMSFGAARQAIPGKASSNQKLEQVVMDHIQNLDSSELKTRTAALNALMEMGPVILPFTEANASEYSPAQQQALQTIRNRLELQKAINSTQATRITLQGKASLAEHCRAITRQSGNKIDITALSPDIRERQLELNFQEQVYWKVLDQICQRSQIAFDPRKQDGEQQGFQLALRDATRSKSPIPHVYYSGPCRISLRRIATKPIVGAQTLNLLRTHWQILCESRLRPIYLSISGRDFKAETATGKTLSNRNPALQFEAPFAAAGGQQSEFYIDFEIEKAALDEPISFSSTMQMVTAAGLDTFRFAKLDQPGLQTTRKGSVSISLKPLIQTRPETKAMQTRFQMDVVYRYQGAAFESYRNWLLQNPIQLQYATGRTVSAESDTRYTIQTGSGARLIHKFENVDEPLEKLVLVYTSPTVIVDIPLRVETKPMTINTERTTP